MKKLIFLALLLLVIWPGEAARLPRKPLIELGPKASLYIGSVRFGLGAEMVINPMRSFGLRMDLAEVSFGDGDTQFYLNLRSLSLDAMIYIPAGNIHPYGYFGFGIGADGYTNLHGRGGLGLGLSVTRGGELYMEPGVIIDFSNAGEVDRTDVWFRFSMGARFGVF